MDRKEVLAYLIHYEPNTRSGVLFVRNCLTEASTVIKATSITIVNCAGKSETI